MIKLYATIRKMQAEVKVCNVKKYNSFDKTGEWIKTQVLPSLFMFTEVVGVEKLLDMIYSQEGKLKPLQREMLKKFKWEYSNRYRTVD